MKYLYHFATQANEAYEYWAIAESVEAARLRVAACSDMPVELLAGMETTAFVLTGLVIQTYGQNSNVISGQTP